MPKLSQKGAAMPASPIRKLVPFADDAKKRGIKVYHLNIGQPDIKTPEVVLDKLQSMKIDVLEYSNSEGIASYRKGLRDYYSDAGISLDVSDILITTGGSEALLFAFNTCFNPGDEIIIPEPFYANYNGFAIATGIKINPVISDIKDGFSLPPISEFEKLITDKTKGILICNPGNPTGYLYSEDELIQLRDLVKKHDLYLFADEVYREFCYDGAVPHSVMNLKGIENNVILIDSVSKRYSMCGARIGALISKNEAVISTALKFAQARLSPPTLAQIAAEAALDTPKSYFSEVINEYVSRRDILVDGLNKIPGVFCPKPKGAFYCMVELPIDNSDRFCEWMLSDYNYNSETVMMAPATGFYATPGLGTKEVRMAYVLNKESLLKSVKILEEALKVYPGRI